MSPVDPLRRGPLSDLDLVERHERGRVRPAVADDERLRDVLRRLELVLEVLRRDVLAARRDDDVLLAVGDLDEAVRVDLGDVAGAEASRRRRAPPPSPPGPCSSRRRPCRSGSGARRHLRAGARIRGTPVRPFRTASARACSSSRRSCTPSGRTPRGSGSRSRRRTRRSPAPAGRRPRSASGGDHRGELGSWRTRAGRRRRRFSAEEASDRQLARLLRACHLPPDGERPVGQAALAPVVSSIALTTAVWIFS